MQSYSKIHEFIEENDVEFIRLAYFDVFGTQKNIAIMSGELERAMKYGISIDGAAIAGFDADIRSDLFLRPDPSTISIVPWRPADGRIVEMIEWNRHPYYIGTQGHPEFKSRPNRAHPLFAGLVMAAVSRKGEK